MSNFRVTQRTLSSNVLNNLQGNLGKMARLQEQLSSGKQISRPSDSPTDTVASLRFKSDIRRSEQMLRNADDALGWLGTADGALTEGLTIVNKVRQLVLTGANATSGPAAREALAAEVDALRQGAIALANTSYLGRPLFGGTADGSAAYDANGVYAGTDGSDGVSGAVTRTVSSGVTVRINVTGPEVFGPNPSPTPADPHSGDLFALFQTISDELRSGSPALGNETLEALDGAMTRMMNALATVGARYNQVETMRGRTTDAILQHNTSLSEVESIDLPEKIVQLQMQEVAYQAALSATQRVIQPSLVSFLR